MVRLFTLQIFAVCSSVWPMMSLLVKSDIAQKQLEMETPAPVAGGAAAGSPSDGQTSGTGGSVSGGLSDLPTTPSKPKRFYGTVNLDATRVGRDAGRIADEVVAHLAGLVGSTVRVTLEIEAEIPSGAPEHVVRTVTENSRTLKFTSQGFEEE
jgi:hypothetical protein